MSNDPLRSLEEMPDRSPQEIFDDLSKERNTYFRKMAQAAERGDEKALELSTLHWQRCRLEQKFHILSGRLDELERRVALNGGR